MGRRWVHWVRTLRMYQFSRKANGMDRRYQEAFILMIVLLAVFVVIIGIDVLAAWMH